MLELFQTIDSNHTPADIDIINVYPVVELIK